MNYSLSRLPTVLFLNAWDGEDYGAQYVYDGLCDLLGWRNVIDWPANPFCHLPSYESQRYDSELYWPHSFHHEYEIHNMLRAGRIDLVVISSTRPTCIGTVRQLAPWLCEARTGIVVLDMEDNPLVTVGEAVHAVGGNVILIGKREYMLNQDYDTQPPVIPLPFSYPRSRMVTSKFQPFSLAFYHAHDWGWADDSPRHRMVTSLRERFGDRVDVGLSSETTKQGRLSIDEYHQRLAHSMIGIALNEGGGSDNNRYWETLASGCVLVSDRPRHVIPFPLVEGEEVLYYSSVNEAVERVAELERDPERAQRIALAGVRKFSMHHTTSARAMYLLAETLKRVKVLPDWVKVQ